MALSVTHRFVSAVADGSDTSVVRPSDWNATHYLTADALSVLGCATSGGTTVAGIAASAANQVLQSINATTIAFTTLSLSLSNFSVAGPSVLAVSSNATSIPVGLTATTIGQVPVLINATTLAFQVLNTVGTISTGTWNGSIVQPTYGGSGIAFFAVSGPGSSIKTFTFPNSSQTVAMLDQVNQTVSGGASVVPFNLGTTANGSALTISFGSSPLQYITWNGTGTFSAATLDGSCMVLLSNSTAAGAITFTGFSGSGGDTYTTNATAKFTISFWRINSVSGYRIAAHQ